MYNFKEVEKKIEENWKKNNTLIKKSYQFDPKKPLFSFLEGPPTANAPPALHHVEVRVFKDLVCRYKYMQGFTVPRKGGWDCHGLPVEVQMEKKLKLNSKKEIINYGTDKFIKECRESVFSYIQEWNKLTEKMAYWVDLENPYSTMDNKYIESVWWSLKQLYDKNLLYEDHKVVPYCPRCETPLSSHEVALGYKDVNDPSVIVKFKVKGKQNRYFLAFTTTPWTLPANVALAVKDDALYVVVKEKNEEYILAKELVNKYFTNPTIIEEIKGKKLQGAEYEPLFNYFVDKLDKKAWFVICADFVTLNEGTGIVHTAPAFGEEDFAACKKNNLPFIQPVTEEGKFTADVSDFKGLFVKNADNKIIDYLKVKSSLFKIEKYMHSYPFCWRCDTPLIYYAMLSWFIKTTSVKERLIALNKEIKWYPKHIQEGRFGDWLNNVKDWALSRKKFWGTPLPIWRCICGNELVIGSLAELQEKAKKVPKNIDLHKPHIDEVEIYCVKCKESMKRVPDVIDCWYDSGSATFAQFHYPFENKEMFEKSFTYDFIAEAIDQTRGWFYTLHVLAILLFNKKAYKQVVCAGHLVDEKGEKMSKSKGNVLDPWEMFETVGVDAVRLQMCMTEPGDQKKFSINTVNKGVLPFLNVLWNCYIFAKEYLKDKKTPNKKPKLRIEDEWICSRINSTIKNVTNAIERHDYHHCMNELITFVDADFSRFYIRLIRDRTAEKDEALTFTFLYVFERINKLLAPFAVYITDYIYLDLINKEKTVHVEQWPKEESVNKRLEDEVIIIRDIITSILAVRDKEKIGIRWPLSKVTIATKEKEVISAIKNLNILIKNQTNIKEVKVVEEEGNDILIFSKKRASTKVNTVLTKELEEEGYARELMRYVQDMRKKEKLQKKDLIDLIIATDINVSHFKEEIKQKVGAKTLRWEKKGEKLEGYLISKKEQIKDKEVEIAFKKC